MISQLSLAGVCLVAVAALGLPATPGGQAYSSVPACRHNGAAEPEDRARREQALILANAINAGQADLMRQTTQYQPVATLDNLPEVPQRFELSFYTSGSGYVFALKDTVDPCRFAIFSDEAGLVYEKSALDAPVLAPR